MLHKIIELVPWAYKLRALIYFSIQPFPEGWLFQFARKHPPSYGKFQIYVCKHICTFSPDCYKACPILCAHEQSVVKEYVIN